MLRSWSVLACLAVLIVGCSDTVDQPPIPEGVLTFSGVLLPAEISLVRRGSHVLTQGDKEICFVESSEVSLRNYEQKLVTLRGHLEPNIEKESLPVLVVDTVVGVADTTKEWSIRRLGITLETPLHWQRDDSPTQALFFVEGSTQPVLSIAQLKKPETDPAGASIILDGKPAFRLVNEATGNQLITVVMDKEIIQIDFTPQGDSVEKQRQDWLLILSSIRIRPLIDTSPPIRTGSGSTGQPCGGPAGVLCPTGEYCDVMDTAEDIGICKPF